MKSLFEDTSAEAEKILIEGLRKKAAWWKLRRVAELNQLVQELALADIRRRHPDASQRELDLRLASRWLSADIMTSAFGWDPRQKGY